MAKEKTLAQNSSLASLFTLGVYKRSQGRVARQVTCGAIWLIVALASWRVLTVTGSRPAFLVVLLVGLFAGYRAVNFPRFAEFLINVENEMNKVSWPSWPELTRSSLVVIVVISMLAIVLFAFDMFWQSFFSWLWSL